MVSECGPSCITLKALIPDLRSSTTDYTVSRISGTDCFRPYISPGNNQSVSGFLTRDDTYSPALNIGFPFSFFGNTYTRLIASPNGVVSFDVSKANARSHYGLLKTPRNTLHGEGGTITDLPNTLYDRLVIMGPYHDLDPRIDFSPNRLIQYQTIGTAPYRKWIISYSNVALYNPLRDSECTGLRDNMHQIVLHESTGLVEVFIYNKQNCSLWNEGRAIVGIQDATKTKAVVAPGRNASDPAWGGPGMQEAWRFTPAAGSSLLKRVELIDLEGNLVAAGTTAAAGNGSLEASFENICSPVGKSSYIVRSVYQKIDDATKEIIGLDTVNVIKVEKTLSATVTTQPTNCGPATGTLSVIVPEGAGRAPYRYALDGGAFEENGLFSGLSEGNHKVVVQDAWGCTVEVEGTVALENNLTVRAMADTALCVGSRLTMNAVASTAGSAFRWTPVDDLNSFTVQDPELTVKTSASYIITATLGNCSAADTVSVVAYPLPVADAGPDQLIVARDVTELKGVASPGTYLWSPAAGLSTTQQLSPRVEILETTEYTLRVTSPEGCTASDRMTVTVVPYCIKPMDAFTPNGDGYNDRWLVTEGNCLQSARVEVFNRYGNKVFESRDYKNTWDGSFNGRPLPDGTYYYVITYVLVTGRTQYMRGNVTLLR